MANTVVKNNNFINVTFDGSTAWDITSSSGLTADLPNGIRVRSIQVVTAATDDTFIIREGSATGPIIYKGTAATAYQEFVRYFNNSVDRRYKLYIKGTEVTAGVVLIVEI